MKRATFSVSAISRPNSHFNPRPREEGDLRYKVRLDLQENFNPRPREEGDCVQHTFPTKINIISIHALVKRATPYAVYGTDTSVISIHALVKRATFGSAFLFIKSRISIHALVKRATVALQAVLNTLSISIHALVKRATYVWHSGYSEYVNFNPRPREEGDAFLFKMCLTAQYFNPRPREEGDRFFI